MTDNTQTAPDAPGAYDDYLCALAMIEAAGRTDHQALEALLSDGERYWPRVIGSLASYGHHLAGMTGDAGAAIGLLRRAVLETQAGQA